MSKILGFDVETTGLDPKKNDVVQLAAYVEIDDKLVGTKDFKCRPFDPQAVEDEALDKQDRTLEEIMEWPDPRKTVSEFTAWTGQWIDKFNQQDKAYPAGYNVSFDLGFVDQWLRKSGEKYGFGSYQNWRPIDPRPIVAMLECKGFINGLVDHKLETVCKHFGVKIDNAHDALSDIMATRDLVNRSFKILKPQNQTTPDIMPLMDSLTDLIKPGPEAFNAVQNLIWAFAKGVA